MRNLVFGNLLPKSFKSRFLTLGKKDELSRFFGGHREVGRSSFYLGVALVRVTELVVGVTFHILE